MKRHVASAMHQRASSMLPAPSRHLPVRHWLGAALVTALLSVPAAAVPDGRCPSMAQERVPRIVEPKLGGAARVSGSSLFSFPAQEVREAEQRASGQRHIELTLHPSGRPGTLILQASVPPTGRIVARITLHPPATGAEGGKTLVTVFEALYAFLLRQDPLSRYEVTSQGEPRLEVAGSHGRVLATVARWRACAVNALRPAGRTAKVAEWETPSLAIQGTGDRTNKKVAARVRTSGGRPVVGAPVAFARGEHMACATHTSPDGVAMCELFDVHGHDDHESRLAPTIVTFGGVVTPGKVLLPSTLVGLAPRRPQAR